MTQIPDISGEYDACAHPVPEHLPATTDLAGGPPDGRARADPVGTLLSAPAYAANPVTPGNFTGLGFDQCEAPSQSAMSTWIKKSPFRAAGIYISGASRACKRQSNLNATWVRKQLAAGWRLMPITLGPAGLVLVALPALRQEHRPDHQLELGQLVRRGQGPGQARGPAGSPGGTQPRPRARQHPLLRPRGLRHSPEHLLHPVGHPVPARLDTHAAHLPLRVGVLLQRRLRASG